MSFLKVVRMAKHSNMPSVLILEDDCLPGNNFKSRWPRMKNWLDTHPDEWDIFNGGGSVTGKCSLYKCAEPDICFFKTTEMWHAHFIYIPQRMYDRVLEYPGKGLIDAWLNQHFNTLSTYPFIGKTQDGYSNIEKRYRRNISGKFSASEAKYRRCLGHSGGTRRIKRRRATRKQR
jgi:hypothetical protein